MIDFYFFPSSVNCKVLLMLEETGLPYTIKFVNLRTKEQFAPDFLKISPNNKVPAIFDSETQLALFESGAILQYLASKTGKFVSKDKNRYYETIQWLYFQASGMQPVLSRLYHATTPVYLSKEKLDNRGLLAKIFCRHVAGLRDPSGVDSLVKELHRLFGVLDKQLASSPYVAGSDYSIADMMFFPTLFMTKFPKDIFDTSSYTSIQRWIEQIETRPAVSNMIAKRRQVMDSENLDDHLQIRSKK